MILKQFDLEGKVAVVTGANTGLGRAMALGLAEAGADIVGVYNSTPPESLEQFYNLGREIMPLKADLSKSGTAGYVLDKSVARFGTVDILVNNAGIIRRGSALDFTEKDWDEVMDINVKSLFFLCQAFAKNCVDQSKGGKIINIASMLSFQGGIRVPSYTASKSGVLGLTRLLACEWAPHSINVNAIAPGYMRTANTQPIQDDPVRNQQILDRIPAGCWGEPEALKGAVVFLASDASAYMHGHTLAVDGGWLAR